MHVYLLVTFIFAFYSFSLFLCVCECHCFRNKTKSSIVVAVERREACQMHRNKGSPSPSSSSKIKSAISKITRISFILSFTLNTFKFMRIKMWWINFRYHTFISSPSLTLSLPCAGLAKGLVNGMLQSWDWFWLKFFKYFEMASVLISIFYASSNWIRIFFSQNLHRYRLSCDFIDFFPESKNTNIFISIEIFFTLHLTQNFYSLNYFWLVFMPFPLHFFSLTFFFHRIANILFDAFECNTINLDTLLDGTSH